LDQWGAEDAYMMIKLQKNQADFNTVIPFYLKTKCYTDAVTQGWKMLKRAYKDLKLLDFLIPGFDVNVLFLKM
jgi:hypothetical protein